MLNSITKLTFIFCFSIFLATTSSAQDFKLKKKINKYVFKPKKGKLNYDLQFDEVEYSLYGEYWKVRRGEFWGIVYNEGLVLEPKFEEVRFNRDINVLVKLNGKFGVFDFKGNQEVDFILDQIDFFYKEKNLVKMGDDWGSILDGKFIKQIDPIFKNPNQPINIEICEGKEEKCFDKYLLERIYRELKYPQEAQSKGIEGKVILALTINRDGKLGDIKVLRGIGGGCDKESVRVAKSLFLKWIPAHHDGVPVKSQYILPIRFRIGRK